MKKKIKPTFDKAEILTLLVYLCAQSTALMYVLCRSHVFVCSVIMTAASFGIFMLFYRLRRHKMFSLLAFVLLFLLVNVVCSIIGNPYYSPSFMEFIFTTSNFFNVYYAGAAILLFSMIIGFTGYYFSVNLPRPGFLLLTAYIPLILGARTLGGLPAGIIVFLAAGYLAAVFGISRAEYPAEITYYDDKNARRERLVVFAAVSVLAALLLLALPKMNNTPFSDRTDNLFRGRTSYYGRQSLTNFMENSVPNRGNNTPSSDTLFYALTNAPQNVSRWSYDVYNGEDGWTYIDEYSTGTAGWENKHSMLSPGLLVRRLKTAVFEGKLSEYRDKIEALESGDPNSAHSMTIRITEGNETSVVMHPNRTFGASVSGFDGKIYCTPKDEMFVSEDMEKNATYVLRYYVEEPNRGLSVLAESGELAQILDKAYEEGGISYEMYSAIVEEKDSAKRYYADTGGDGNVPDSVRALAQEITAGLTNDYDKAKAIEKWFGTADFVYDLNFVPEESTAEYFLLESRRGICTDFATASTLLLRAAGIPARYTEGFVLKEDSRDINGRYVVTAAEAHAYATAYIEGCGWIEIDGTKYARTEDAADRLQTVLFFVLLAMVIIAVPCIIFRRQLSELVFAVRFRFMSKKNRIKAVYLRTRRLVCKIPDISPESATAEEVRDIVSRTLSLEREADEITSAANELFYGGNIPDADEWALYRDYKTIRRIKRSRDK